ncbi:hypothetical protein BGX26_002444 [Mortierella sp. AD094]|nr:hypothetical protein BGX26_002444 [Mortierella sp. AD094]
MVAKEVPFFRWSLVDDIRVFDDFLKNIPLSTFCGRPDEVVQDRLSEIDEYFDLVNMTPAQRLSPIPSKCFARSKIYELKQRSSVTKYISEFENLRLRIDDLGEAEAMQAFLNGSRPKLQENFAGNPSLRVNLAMIMQIAESLDSIHHRNQVNF